MPNSWFRSCFETENENNVKSYIPGLNNAEMLKGNFKGIFFQQVPCPHKKQEQQQQKRQQTKTGYLILKFTVFAR